MDNSGISLKNNLNLKIKNSVCPEEKTYTAWQTFTFLAFFRVLSNPDESMGMGLVGQFPSVKDVIPPQKSMASCNSGENSALMEAKLRRRR